MEDGITVRGGADGAPKHERFLEQMDRQLAGWEGVSRLVQALERDELVLYAQPILALRGPTAQFPIAEVLVRLREEERTLQPPGDFLPVFEHYGMMPELDRWVVRHVMERLARGSRTAQFSINVSAQTLGDAQFAPFVAAELAKARVAAAALIFEIDENHMLAMPEAAATFAASVKAVGCGVLIDGFGQRAVSFAPLTNLRADFVKVDGVIVRNLRSSEMARSKLNAIARVGQVIGVGVIGECVEEQDTLDRLRAASADYAQGFGLRRPAPLDSIAEGAA
ncbi:MAG: EAL domain-containing protein [Burkholderiales bacterium]